MRGVLLVGVLLLGCAPASPPNAGRPEETASCPRGAPVPFAPRAPRTVEQIGAYANALAVAVDRTEAARAECARRLALLNAWIDSRAP